MEISNQVINIDLYNNIQSLSEDEFGRLNPTQGGQQQFDHN